MRKSFLFMLMMVIFFANGCSDALKKTDEFSLKIPWNWVECKKEIYNPEGAMSPDGKVFHASSKGYEFPQEFINIARDKYARVVIMHFKITAYYSPLNEIDNFFNYLLKDYGDNTLEKGETILGKKRAFWCVFRSLIPVSQEGTSSKFGERRIDNYMNNLNLNYLVEKNPGDFYLISLQTKERVFPAFRPLFEKIAQTFQFN